MFLLDCSENGCYCYYHPDLFWKRLDKKALAIQNARCETLGTFEGLLKSYSHETEVVDATKESVLPSPRNYDAIMILGGPMSVYDNSPSMQAEMQPIKQGMRMDIPILGVCLGSQLIAQAAGGDVFKGARKEIGWRPVHATNEGKQDLLNGLEDPLWIFQWHGDTYQLPPSAQLLAFSDLYPQAFRVGSALGVQFHVEADNGLARSWISEYKAEVESEGLRPDDIIGDQNMFSQLPEICSRILRNFLSDRR